MLSQLPSLRILIPFLVGIASWQLGLRQLSALHIGVSICTLVCFFTFHQLSSSYHQYKHSWVRGIIITIVMMLCGNTICKLHQVQLHPKHYCKHVTNSTKIIARIIEPITKKSNSYKTIIEVKTCIQSSASIATIGNSFLYFTKAKNAPLLLPGDEIILQGNLVPLLPNKNPGGFDYASYSLQKGITHTIYATPNQYIYLHRNASSLSTFFANQKIKCLAIMHQYITDSNAIGVADALLLGDRTLIDDETWNAYKDTGIVHIIAISGMHLGFVYHGFLSLIFLIPFFKKREKATIIIALLIMWGFSCLIGMPPSVARAGLIFTIMGIGKIIGRKNYPYNSLLISAFILLCIEPNWITDVGFLLSYAAIVGILLFAQKWSTIFYSNNVILKYVNSTIATTLAAQVFTLPICLYYFHQFPVLLLLSNLIAIFATTYILYTEIILLSLAWCPMLVKPIGVIITKSIVLLNKIILFMSTIPFFNIKNISISYIQYILLFTSISIFCVAYFYKQKHALFLSLQCLIVFFSIHLYKNYEASHQQKLIVHHTKNKSIIQLLHGTNYQIMTTDTIINNDEKYILSPAQILFRANNKTTFTGIRTANYSLQMMKDKSILLLNGNLDSSTTINNIDYLIIGKHAKNSLIQLATQLHPKHIVIDGANSLWKIAQLETQASALHLHIYNTAKQGAFIVDL